MTMLSSLLRQVAENPERFLPSVVWTRAYQKLDSEQTSFIQGRDQPNCMSPSDPFLLSCAMAEIIRANTHARGLVLASHVSYTWSGINPSSVPWHVRYNTAPLYSLMSKPSIKPPA